jgi:hypothetical protein
MASLPSLPFGPDGVPAISLLTKLPNLHDAILVVGLFNLMNRILFGHGVDDHRAHYGGRLTDALHMSDDERRQANEKDLGSTPYQEFGRSLQDED